MFFASLIIYPLKAWIDAALTDKCESLSFIYFLAGKTVSQLHGLSIETLKFTQKAKLQIHNNILPELTDFLSSEDKGLQFSFHVTRSASCVSAGTRWLGTSWTWAVVFRSDESSPPFFLSSSCLILFFSIPPPPPCRVLFWYLQCSSGLWPPAVMSPHLTPPSLPSLHFIFLPSASLSASGILLHFSISKCSHSARSSSLSLSVLADSSSLSALPTSPPSVSEASFCSVREALTSTSSSSSLARLQTTQLQNARVSFSDVLLFANINND